jgi:hypothetical protein
MSGEDAPRPYLENLIVLTIKINKQPWVIKFLAGSSALPQPHSPTPCISLSMRLFWRSSHDTCQYLASHVLGDLGRTARRGLHLLVALAQSNLGYSTDRGFRAKLVTAQT